MTDLERVLGFIKKREDWEEAELIVYGHLEEAKRLKEAISKLAVQRAEDGAELDRLREYLEDMTRDRDNLVVREGEALDENAKLREDLRAAYGSTGYEVLSDYKAENARLRKELERSRQDDSEWKATIERTNAENAKLREEVQAWEESETPELMRENARLREQRDSLQDALWEMQTENARLLNARRGDAADPSGYGPIERRDFNP